MIRSALIVLASVLLPLSGQAQVRDSVFADYASYETFVNTHVMARDFMPLVQDLGGRDEYTEADLAGITRSLRMAFPRDFENAALFKLVPLENGFFQEARAYWTGEQYGWYYAMLHDTGAELVVINFTLNTDVAVILAKF
ncbi:hypothetical protein [Roseisalinus antarcticus]|uniref:Uncharacterized protein n=1 Tax=Roseisalinus antarcticus TaxID=254357 RepID=A0A1Y5RAQ5_9RHOB|nr:hypothetical protein [Roseisalinus antarcticus]SLN12977.1 hypothetical protein ROA7023_00019 [Roseisalinus antarcticus]